MSDFGKGFFVLMGLFSLLAYSRIDINIANSNINALEDGETIVCGKGKNSEIIKNGYKLLDNKSILSKSKTVWDLSECASIEN